MTSTRAARQSGAGRPRRAGANRGSPMLRLRIGFVLIAMVLSFFGARLVQLQAIDPKAYAPMAKSEGAVVVPIVAERGEILDRNGEVLAGSVKGKMVLANPAVTADDAAELAKLLSDALDVDYFKTLSALKGRKSGSQFEYVARRVPSTLAEDTLAAVEAADLEGIWLEDDPIRDYPADDVAANLLGFMGTDEPLGGFERTFDQQLAGKDGEATWQSSSRKSVRIPLRESTLTPAVHGEALRTTIDRDLQFFTQRVLAQTVQAYRAESGAALVMDTRTGEILALADVPTFDANKPLEADEDDLGSRALNDAYEPGSVQKVLTAAALIDAGKAFPRQRFKVPGVLRRQDRPIGDWFDHGTIKLTLAGILAKSSNIGTVLAADAFSIAELVGYLHRFGLGQRTNVGVRGETPGILTPAELMTSQTKDRVAFGQSLSVNVVQMAAAVNTVANDGVRVSPSLIRGTAVTDDGVTVGTDTASRTRVISRRAARGTARMMEKVVHPEDGVAPRAQVPGYLVAGKTGTAQRVLETGGYGDETTVSFGGFAPADDARFTVYVVVHAPRVDGGGGSVAGPVFARIMGYVLARYGVTPTGGTPSRLPVEWR